MTWASERDFWSRYLSCRLRGKWRRLESLVGSGWPDTYGLWRGKAIWLELKVGPPNKNRLEPGQIEFALDCERHSHPFFLCFGHRGRAFFFAGMDVDTIVHPPWFSERRLR